MLNFNNLNTFFYKSQPEFTTKRTTERYTHTPLDSEHRLAGWLPAARRGRKLGDYDVTSGLQATEQDWLLASKKGLSKARFPQNRKTHVTPQRVQESNERENPTKNKFQKKILFAMLERQSTTKIAVYFAYAKNASTR